MELSRDFIENTIFGDYIIDCFRKDELDLETFEELHKIVMVEYDYEAGIIRVIKNIKLRRYKEARNDVPFRNEFAEELLQLRCVIKSLLKGIMATSSIVSLSEIKEARIRWIRYDDQQDSYDSQGYHNQVYREFKKVESLEELDRFNVYFQNYILDLVFGLSEIYIRRLHYTIEHFKENATFEETCIKGTINLEKFKFDLEEVKTFTPELRENVPPENKPARADQGTIIQPDPQKNEPETKGAENRNQIKARPIGGWLWAIMVMLFVSGLVTLVTLIRTAANLSPEEWFSYFSTSDKLVKQWILMHAYIIIVSLVALILIPLTLNSFFNRKKNFKDMFVGLLGFTFTAEFIRVAWVVQYSSLADQPGLSPENNLIKIGIVLMIAGLYLNKGKRPLQTFKN